MKSPFLIPVILFMTLAGFGQSVQQKIFPKYENFGVSPTIPNTLAPNHSSLEVHGPFAHDCDPPINTILGLAFDLTQILSGFVVEKVELVVYPIQFYPTTPSTPLILYHSGDWPISNNMFLPERISKNVVRPTLHGQKYSYDVTDFFKFQKSNYGSTLMGVGFRPTSGDDNCFGISGYGGAPNYHPHLLITYTASPYALKRSVDGGYGIAYSGALFFEYQGEYNDGLLNYRVLNDEKVDQDSPIKQTSLENGGIKTYGHNLFKLDVSNLASSAYYTLEVTNEKNEIFYLRFYTMH